MDKLTGARKSYDWGSPHVIPEFCRQSSDGHPFAELWFGDHPLGEATIANIGLSEYINRDASRVLGRYVADTFGSSLPFILKYLAVESPLSLQVHPSKHQAEVGFRSEDAAGIQRDAFHRNYRDVNHKPEMIYALTKIEALSGFRARRRIVTLFEGLQAPLAQWIHRVMVASLSEKPDECSGIRTVTETLLDKNKAPDVSDIDAVISNCRERIASGASPSVRTDSTAVLLAKRYPGDVGAILSMLLNPVTLHPGEVLFTPAGTIHTLISGFGFEVMAASDNVLRVGLTNKHIDVDRALKTINFHAAPPMRIAPEEVGSNLDVYYAPIDDFELAVSTLERGQEQVFSCHGARLLAVVQGSVNVFAGRDYAQLQRGEVVFVPAFDGPARVVNEEHNVATVIQVDVP